MQQLPACEPCHGPGGRGVDRDFPHLAGQGAACLAQQLSAWPTGPPPPGPMGLMAVVAQKRSEADVFAVAEYGATQPAKGHP